MNNSDLIVLGLAGVAVWLIFKGQKAGASLSPGTGAGTVSGRTEEIFGAGGLPFDNGWRYYSDGTSISPDGAYYKGGQLIWKP